MDEIDTVATVIRIELIKAQNHQLFTSINCIVQYNEYFPTMQSDCSSRRAKMYYCDHSVSFDE